MAGSVTAGSWAVAASVTSGRFDMSAPVEKRVRLSAAFCVAVIHDAMPLVSQQRHPHCLDCKGKIATNPGYEEST
ncbi:hypothetical protein HHA01_05910 [Halomonas halmophila]|uniref:Uncharacterized protein n=1 Tax=Halomonas halmophila TaxID=252 RepID=A0A4Y4F199_9GAMM|nr:hypothetical protein HHA01_05910 [Halomonas halmophila]